MRSLVQYIRTKTSAPWLVVTLFLVVIIWGNSLVPGEGSGSLSLAVMEAVREVLRSLGAPYGWVTNFLIRKSAHFCEYLVLGVCASQAIDPTRSVSRGVLVATAAFCVSIPSVDETIQLFVAGRAGQLSDVLLDCLGAATGMALRTVFAAFARHRADALGA